MKQRVSLIARCFRWYGQTLNIFSTSSSVNGGICSRVREQEPNFLVDSWSMTMNPPASFFFGVRIMLGNILGRFSIIYFRGLGLRIKVMVWVMVRVWVGVGVRVSVMVMVSLGLGAIQVLRNAIFLEIGPPPTPS